MQMISKFTSVHVPKAGGVTFFYILKKIYGKSLLHDNLMSPLSPLVSTIHYPKSWDKYSVIHGHFDYSKYDHLPLITWIRNPIDRVISHYCYWKFKRINRHQRTNIYHKLLIEKNLNIYEFAELLPNVTTTLVGEKVNRYLFIGLLEYFDFCLDTFYKKFELTPVDYQIRNINRKKPKNFMAKVDRNKIAQFVKKDMEFYKEVLSEWRLRFD